MQHRAPPPDDEFAPDLIDRGEFFRVPDALVEPRYRLLLRRHLTQASHRSGTIGRSSQLSLELIMSLEQGLRVNGSLLPRGLQAAIIVAQRKPCSKLFAHGSCWASGAEFHGLVGNLV